LFGRTATLVVPTGRDNVADLLEIFVKLDTSLSELKQENKVLKETVARHEAEIGRLQLRSGMPQLLQVAIDRERLFLFANMSQFVFSHWSGGCWRVRRV